MSAKVNMQPQYQLRDITQKPCHASNRVLHQISNEHTSMHDLTIYTEHIKKRDIYINGLKLF